MNFLRGVVVCFFFSVFLLFFGRKEGTLEIFFFTLAPKSRQICALK